MREFEFKGKRIDTGEWVEGWYSCGTKGGWLNPIQNGHYITTFTKLENGEVILTGCHEVDPNTVGQYTGLKDCTGREIYEGDIVKNSNAVGVVKFGNPDFLEGSLTSMFYIEVVEVLDYEIFTFKGDIWTEFNAFEIISNVHNNPELLKTS